MTVESAIERARQYIADIESCPECVEGTLEEGTLKGHRDDCHLARILRAAAAANDEVAVMRQKLLDAICPTWGCDEKLVCLKCRSEGVAP